MADLVPGGRYRLLAPLGRGGEGEVWSVRDTLLGVERAAKRVPLAECGEEARVAASLSHANVVAVYDMVDVADARWTVLERCAGSTADWVTRYGPMPARRVALLGADVARALAHAHERGIVHRDLKPENVLIAAGGVAKLADFGAATRWSDPHRSTATGALLGTLPFMAPEQRRSPRSAGPPADQYGLAATLAWMATGAPAGDLFEPGCADALRQRVPDVLAEVLLRAGRHEPEERWPDASAMADALGRAAGCLEEVAAPALDALSPPANVWTAPADVALASEPVATGKPPSTSRPRDTTAMFTLAASLAALVAAVTTLWTTTPGPGPSAPAGRLPMCPQVWEPAATQRVLGPRETVGVTAGDLDGDGHPEVVYANQLDASLSIYWGDGTARLGTAQELSVGRVSGSVGIGDADQDGRADLFVADADTSTLTAWLQRQGRSFVAGPTSTQPALTSGRPVQLIDWEGDGVDDLVLNDLSGVLVRRGSGGGQFSETGERVADGAGWAERGHGPAAIWATQGAGVARWVRGTVTSRQDGMALTIGATTRVLSWDGGALALLEDERLVDLTAPAPCIRSAPQGTYVTAATDLDHDGVPELLGFMTCSGCTSNHVLKRMTAR